MKTYLSISLIFVSIILFGQTRNDTVDFNNVNIPLLNDLLFEKANDERKKVSSPLLIKHEVCFLAAKYQSEYMAQHKIVCHKNELPYKGVTLYSFQDRVKFFSKNIKGEMFANYEICLMREHFIDSFITYDNLAYKLINQFMNSKPHRIILLHKKSVHSDTFTGFSTSITKNEKKIKFYVASVGGTLY